MAQPEIAQFFVEVSAGTTALSGRILGAFELDSATRKLTNVERLEFTIRTRGTATGMDMFSHDGVKLVTVPLDAPVPVAKRDTVAVDPGEVNMDFGFCIFCAVKDEEPPRIDETIAALKKLEAELREELKK
jgi:hypothetical protein